MATVDPEPLDLPAEDGIPMESSWHRSAMNLLIDVVQWQLRGRTDYYVGGNTFIYYATDQARTWKYRGADFFFVDKVDGTRERRYWCVWEEAGRYPDVIVELTSPSTADEDHGPKKTIYERTFRTPDYFCYDPDQRLLEGWRLGKQRRYQNLKPNERGWLWCEALDLWLGLWEGRFQNQQAFWPRFYDSQGNLIRTEAEAERQRAETERQRAEAAEQREKAEAEKRQATESELARLQAYLVEKGLPPPAPGDQ